MSNVLLADQDVAYGYKPATKHLEEPCWNQTEEVYRQLQLLNSCAEEDKPSAATLDWAYMVLFSKVLPRMLLRGAEVDAFAGEVHVTWETQSARIVAFFPAANSLKVYRERIENGRATDHNLIPNANAVDLCEALRPLF
jgi:hypothetical protein